MKKIQNKVLQSIEIIQSVFYGAPAAFQLSQSVGGWTHQFKFLM